MSSERASQQVFFGTSALLFAANAALTVAWSASMSAMKGMQMPGGWTMSMAWMRMPGQTWIAAPASFLAMWVVMMAAMMLPSLVPMLCRYRKPVSRAHHASIGGLTTLVALGYFAVWTLLGFAVFPICAAVTSIEMEQPILAHAVPIAAGVTILIAGSVQLTKWKAHHLTRCREAPGRNSVLPAHPGSAWRQGLRFGFHCSLSCANLTAILLVVGVMDLRAMIAVTAAITAERLAPDGERVARTIGLVVIATGLFLILRALRPE